MNTGVGSVFYGDEEPDIAEVSPNGHYVRYHEIVEEGRGGKVGYKGFDEDYGRDVTWNKIQVVDSFRAEQLLLDSDRFLKPFKHDNIIEYYSSWVDHETSHINIITESFTSGCLRKFRKKHKSVETNAIKKWARQVLQGLCFLHTHDPPIVHGSLTCDNIFINGNTGEVKIGDPGLGNILQHPPLELLEEVFNEDFDVYLFGMCMLELATSQIPFSEFETVRDMYRKRIESGTMPDALAKVKDAQFKQFIENCLVSGSAKVSITELLEDSFLKTPTLPSSGRDPLVSVFELRRIIRKSEFRLKGETTLKGLVLFKLLVDNLRGKKLDIEFEFDPQADTTLKVAGEMIDAFDLSSEDIILVAELMDRLIFRMVPCWKPSLVDFSAVNNSYGDLVPAF